MNSIQVWWVCMHIILNSDIILYGANNCKEYLYSTISGKIGAKRDRSRYTLHTAKRDVCGEAGPISHADPINYIYVRLAFSRHSHFIAGKCCLGHSLHYTTPSHRSHTPCVHLVHFYSNIVSYRWETRNIHLYYTIQCQKHTPPQHYTTPHTLHKQARTAKLGSLPRKI